MEEAGKLALAIAAVGLIGLGCWWLHPAAALIAVGVLLLAGVVIGIARGGKSHDHND